MPRTERELDPGDTPLLRFAGDLRLLRRKAGNPPYRQLAQRAFYSAAALSEAASGRKLPSLAVTLAYVRACEGDGQEWETRWHALAAALAAGAGDGDDGTVPPYAGLAALQPEDAGRFAGRERLVEELLAKLAERRLVAVFGASGAGKSSLLRAGLIPRWTAGRPDRAVVLLTPGPHPPAGLSAPPGAAEVLVVVDQFEETFTLCADPEQRSRFVTALTTAAAPGSPSRVVLGVRADFYPHCTGFPELVEGLRDAQVVVGPMSTGELRRAVSEPAVRSGHAVESALLATVVADAAGRAGVLPLLSHALLETWRRRRGTTLTLTGYQAAGGIDGALAHTAESAYRALTPQQQRVARHLLLRLTALGDGTEDTKRRIRRDEVDLAGRDTRLVVDRLTAARLLTLDRDSIEITHESLIRRWPRLHGWLTEDREALRVHRRLTEAARVWRSTGRDPGALYRGTPLALAEEWAAGRDGLSPDEAEFLAAGLAARATEEAAARRRGRRMRRLVALLSVLCLVATAATGLAVRASRAAARERDAVTSLWAADRADALRVTSPALAARLGLAAYRLSPTLGARSSVLSSFATPYATQLTGAGEPRSAAFSPDGRLLATGGEDHVVRLWHLGDRREMRALRGHTSPVRAVAFDGPVLVAAAEDGTVRRWDVGGGGAGPRDQLLTVGPGDTVRVWGDPGRAPRLLRLGTGVAAAAMTRDGKTLATGGDDKIVRLWDVTGPGGPRQLAALDGHTDAVRAVAFGPDGRTLVSGGADATVRLWSVRDPRRPHALTVLPGHTTGVTAVAVGPDGAGLATAGADRSLRLWDLPGSRLIGHESSVYAVAFAPGGRTVATGSYDRTVRLWDVAQRRESAVLRGHAGPVNDVAFRPGTGTLASASHDGTVRFWATATGAPLPGLRYPGSIEAMAFRRDGRMLAAASHDGTIRLSQFAGGRPTPAATITGHAGSVESVQFRPDGAVLASGGADGTVRLWDLADPARPRSLAVLHAHAQSVKTVAFAPGGGLLATGGDDGTLRVWDVTRPRSPAGPVTLGGYADGVMAAAFGPDGRTLATASSDETVRLWDVTDARRPVERAVLTGHDKPVDALAFAPDGRTVATGGEDWTTVLWDLSVDRTAGKICSRTDPAPLREAWSTYFPGRPYRSPC
ncbi:nSTAND1 domain-containing NTPase [Actinoplanes sp. RD1]|uniref:nSTAND1 domain-containing NTPase n=1 Tax=Actinoplanes sp. RD1 TaxID=3064538 RepID=UPI00274187C5|nr:hypothetical protein [Actinoplanes sp. RD1]